VSFIVFPLCGWLFGRWLWTTGEDRYRALTRGEWGRDDDADRRRHDDAGPVNRRP
jgi:hypothetical protein